MKFQALQFLFLFCFANSGYGQFAGGANSATSNAIHKDSSIIIGWANNCTIERGRVDIANSNSPLASFGLPSDALGPADEFGIVSLGDSGIATLTFAHPIFNGNGPDFAIFENSFSDSFLELGHVEVSSDGLQFFRFPSDFLQTTTQQNGPYDQFGEPEKINNLAGKYRSGYGTPFDLEEMTGISGLNINAITHIRIIDAVGSITGPHGTTDQNGNFFNDPYPTPFPSGGFDLDALAVMYFSGINELLATDTFAFSVFPNPTNRLVHITSNHSFEELILLDGLGKVVLRTSENRIDLIDLEIGIYQLQIRSSNGTWVTKKLIKL